MELTRVITIPMTLPSLSFYLHAIVSRLFVDLLSPQRHTNTIVTISIWSYPFDSCAIYDLMHVFDLSSHLILCESFNLAQLQMNYMLQMEQLHLF